jgi:hypothetical protein
MKKKPTKYDLAMTRYERWSQCFKIDGVNIKMSKLKDLRAIQNKKDWAREIRNRWYQKWNILLEDLKPFGTVWMRHKEIGCIGRLLTCSKSSISEEWGISTDWIKDDEAGMILTTPNKELPLLIGSLSPTGEETLYKRLQGEIKEAPERPDLIKRYSSISYHLQRVGRFIGSCHQIIISYIYNKYGDTLYKNKFSDTLVKLTINGREYIYIHKNGTSYDRHNLITPEDPTITEII